MPLFINTILQNARELLKVISFEIFKWPLKGPLEFQQRRSLFAACVFGDGLGALADSVLGEFTGQEQTDSGLDLSAGDG